MPSLSLVDILKYVEGDQGSRNLTEGEAVLNAGYLIACGRSAEESTGNVWKVLALCLQTSALTSPPHTINATFTLDGDSVTISDIVCSCKAGQGKQCKHCVAVLLFINR